MREGKKKVFLLCAVSAACLCFFGGCREEKQVKTDFETGFYSLTEAYENGWLTKADVKQIADYRGGAQSRPELDAAARSLVPNWMRRRKRESGNLPRKSIRMGETLFLRRALLFGITGNIAEATPSTLRAIATIFRR